MLKIYFGEIKGALEYPDFFFDRLFDKEYMLTKFSQDVVFHVDKSKVLGKNVIESPILGGISPRDLSTGVKNTLICRYYSDRVVCFSFMGENCLNLLFKEIAVEGLNRTICSDILYVPYNYGYVGSIEILNSGRIVKDDRGYFDEYLRWKEGAFS